MPPITKVLNEKHLCYLGELFPTCEPAVGNRRLPFAETPACPRLPGAQGPPAFSGVWRAWGTFPGLEFGEKERRPARRCGGTGIGPPTTRLRLTFAGRRRQAGTFHVLRAGICGNSVSAPAGVGDNIGRRLDFREATWVCTQALLSHCVTSCKSQHFSEVVFSRGRSRW